MNTRRDEHPVNDLYPPTVVRHVASNTHLLRNAFVRAASRVAGTRGGCPSHARHGGGERHHLYGRSRTTCHDFSGKPRRVTTLVRGVCSTKVGEVDEHQQKGRSATRCARSCRRRKSADDDAPKLIRYADFAKGELARNAKMLAQYTQKTRDESQITGCAFPGRDDFLALRSQSETRVLTARVSRINSVDTRSRKLPNALAPAPHPAPGRVRVCT